jgi:hypothetical protein
MSDPSFKGVNYSIRPSKTIQRGLVFEGLRALKEDLDWAKASYVGMGSIWFTDFILAHKALGLNRMVSIESHPIGFRRASFNKPYRFVRMKEGFTYDVIPSLYEHEARFPKNPAIVWLDYDQGIDDDKLDEIRYVVDNATDDSVLLVTFNANDHHYGNDPASRIGAVRDLFGNLVPQQLKGSRVSGLRLGNTLADLTENVMLSTSLKIRKVNPCVPAFRLVYQDSATMVTVGAVFPRADRHATVKRRVTNRAWVGRPSDPVIAPHLTSKEASILQANLPLRSTLNRQDVQALGFDLEEEQIKAFSNFYRHYPMFAQIIS